MRFLSGLDVVTPAQSFSLSPRVACVSQRILAAYAAASADV
jgi:hypothetical protein